MTATKTRKELMEKKKAEKLTLEYLRGLKKNFKREVAETVKRMNKEELNFALRAFGVQPDGKDQRKAMRRHLLNVAA